MEKCTEQKLSNVINIYPKAELNIGLFLINGFHQNFGGTFSDSNGRIFFNGRILFGLFYELNYNKNAEVLNQNSCF